MGTLMVFLVILVSILALVQLAKLYVQSKNLKGESEEEVSDADNSLNALLFLLFGVVLFVSYLWMYFRWKDMLLPVSASEHGVITDDLMGFNMMVVNAVFFIVNGALFLFAFLYQRKKGISARYFPHKNSFELVWTIVPTVVMAIIITYGLSVWNTLTSEAPEDALVIELYGRQFDWTARYGGDNNALGRANVRFITSDNFVGLDESDTTGLDDKIVKGEFHIPVGRAVKFMFRSQDVLHSAYMPHFRSQMNCVPGMITSWHFVPRFTTKEMREQPDVIKKYNTINKIREAKGKEATEFDFLLLCNKICGSSHYNMQMKIVVDTPEEYKVWLKEKKTFAQTQGLDKESIEAPQGGLALK